MCGHPLGRTISLASPMPESTPPAGALGPRSPARRPPFRGAFELPRPPARLPRRLSPEADGNAQEDRGKARQSPGCAVRVTSGRGLGVLGLTVASEEIIPIST